MVKRKIAISGKANSGKNTVAELLGAGIIFLLEQSNPSFKIFAFADPIKEMIMKMYPQTDRNILWGPSYLRETLLPNSTSVTYRKVLTDIGKLARSYDDNIWINSTTYSLNEYLYENKNNIALLSDCRFQNELKAVKNNDFFVIRVKRKQDKLTADSNDISETDLDNVSDSEFDFVLDNNGTLDDLKAKIKDLTHFLT